MAADGVKSDLQSELYELQEVLWIFIESDLHELTLEMGGLKLSVSKSTATQVDHSPGDDAMRASTDAFVSTAAHRQEPHASGSDPAAKVLGVTPEHDREAAHPVDSDVAEVRSPSGGLFYRCPAPGEPPYVEVGHAVKAGDRLCLIEVMKMFTEVTSPVDGTVIAILVDSEEVITQGSVLMEIRPDRKEGDG